MCHDSKTDEKLSSVLDKELSNCCYNEVRKTMQDVKVILISMSSLISEKNDSAHEGFTITWKDAGTGKDGYKIDDKPENHGCE